eukprot:m.889761 g.889761  ORF g.889761 m.889761 type:complete len:1973 (+) comp59948_c0_seq2:1284-7202(+)
MFSLPLKLPHLHKHQATPAQAPTSSLISDTDLFLEKSLDSAINSILNALFALAQKPLTDSASEASHSATPSSLLPASSFGDLTESTLQLAKQASVPLDSGRLSGHSSPRSSPVMFHPERSTAAPGQQASGTAAHDAKPLNSQASPKPTRSASSATRLTGRAGSPNHRPASPSSLGSGAVRRVSTSEIESSSLGRVSPLTREPVTAVAETDSADRVRSSLSSQISASVGLVHSNPTDSAGTMTDRVAYQDEEDEADDALVSEVWKQALKDTALGFQVVSGSRESSVSASQTTPGDAEGSSATQTVSFSWAFEPLPADIAQDARRALPNNVLQEMYCQTILILCELRESPEPVVVSSDPLAVVRRSLATLQQLCMHHADQFSEETKSVLIEQLLEFVSDVRRWKRSPGFLQSIFGTILVSVVRLAILSDLPVALWVQLRTALEGMTHLEELIGEWINVVKCVAIEYHTLFPSSANQQLKGVVRISSADRDIAGSNLRGDGKRDGSPSRPRAGSGGRRGHADPSDSPGSRSSSTSKKSRGDYVQESALDHTDPSAPPSPADSIDSKGGKPKRGNAVTKFFSRLTTSSLLPAKDEADPISEPEPEISSGAIAETQSEFAEFSNLLHAHPHRLLPLWTALLSLLGNINVIKSPDSHRHVLETLALNFELLSSRYMSARAPRLPHFLPSLFEATRLPEPFALSRIKAYEILCRIACHHGSPLLSGNVLLEFYRAILVGLHHPDTRIRAAILGSAGSLFTRGLPGVTLLAPVFISACSSVILENTSSQGARAGAIATTKHAVSLLASLVSFQLSLDRIPLPELDAALFVAASAWQGAPSLNSNKPPSGSGLPGLHPRSRRTSYSCDDLTALSIAKELASPSSVVSPLKSSLAAPNARPVPPALKTRSRTSEALKPTVTFRDEPVGQQARPATLQVSMKRSQTLSDEMAISARESEECGEPAASPIPGSLERRSVSLDSSLASIGSAPRNLRLELLIGLHDAVVHSSDTATFAQAIKGISVMAFSEASHEHQPSYLGHCIEILLAFLPHRSYALAEISLAALHSLSAMSHQMAGRNPGLVVRVLQAFSDTLKLLHVGSSTEITPRSQLITSLLIAALEWILDLDSGLTASNSPLRTCIGLLLAQVSLLAQPSTVASAPPATSRPAPVLSGSRVGSTMDLPTSCLETTILGGTSRTVRFNAADIARFREAHDRHTSGSEAAPMDGTHTPALFELIQSTAAFAADFLIHFLHTSPGPLGASRLDSSISETDNLSLEEANHHMDRHEDERTAGSRSERSAGSPASLPASDAPSRPSRGSHEALAPNSIHRDEASAPASPVPFSSPSSLVFASKALSVSQGSVNDLGLREHSTPSNLAALGPNAKFSSALSLHELTIEELIKDNAVQVYSANNATFLTTIELPSGGVRVILRSSIGKFVWDIQEELESTEGEVVEKPAFWRRLSSAAPATPRQRACSHPSLVDCVTRQSQSGSPLALSRASSFANPRLSPKAASPSALSRTPTRIESLPADSRSPFVIENQLRKRFSEADAPRGVHGEAAIEFGDGDDGLQEGDVFSQPSARLGFRHLLERVCKHSTEYLSPHISYAESDVMPLLLDGLDEMLDETLRLEATCLELNRAHDDEMQQHDAEFHATPREGSVTPASPKQPQPSSTTPLQTPATPDNARAASTLSLSQTDLSVGSRARRVLLQSGLFQWAGRRALRMVEKTDQLFRNLKHLDAQESSIREHHKIAVVYVGSGDEDRDRILKHSSGSPRFERVLLDRIGWPVNLTTHKGYSGGLKSNQGPTVYFATAMTEIVFHVSTLLPPDPRLKLQHIGNDEVHIVWSENSLPYQPNTITKQFATFTVVVYPVRGDLYRIQIAIKDGRQQLLGRVGPLFDGAVVAEAALAPLLRATAVNANRLLRAADGAAQMKFRSRAQELQRLVQAHSARLEFQSFATCFLTASSAHAVQQAHAQQFTHAESAF